MQTVAGGLPASLQSCLMDGWAQDLRYALRALARKPLFSSICVVCLALGIATSTTMFSVFDAVVLSPPAV